MPAPWMYELVTPDPGHPDLGRASQAGTPLIVGRPTTSIQQIMRRFDCLPPRVRRALAEAAHPWAPHWASRVLQRGWTADAVVERLRRADAEEARDRELQLLYGQG